IRPRSDSSSPPPKYAAPPGSRTPPASSPPESALPASSASSPDDRVPLLPLAAAPPDNSGAIAFLSLLLRPGAQTDRPAWAIAVVWHTAGSPPAGPAWWHSLNHLPRRPVRP